MAATTDICTQVVDVEELVEEIERYLATVELFRSEGQEPFWEPEQIGAANAA